MCVHVCCQVIFICEIILVVVCVVFWYMALAPDYDHVWSWNRCQLDGHGIGATCECVVMASVLGGHVRSCEWVVMATEIRVVSGVGVYLVSCAWSGVCEWVVMATEIRGYRVSAGEFTVRSCKVRG